MKPEQLNDNDDVFGEGSKTKNSVVTEEEVVDGVNTNIPPFLRKISEIVDDPESDPIVSWSVTRDSFVVWDSQEFSKNILPNYFKHSNFLSFIHQLNTYGFRKVDSYRWEFANEAFQGGKKHLLKNIKRRSKCNKLHQGSFNSLKPDLEDEVEKLKKDLKLLKVEIPKLRQQHENSHIELCNVEERIRCAELKQHQMLGTQFPVSFPKAMNTTPNVEHRHQGSEQLSILQSELIGLLSEIVNTSKMESLEDELCSSRQGLRAIVSEASFAYDVMSEKLMGESSVVDEEVYVNDSNIYLELEDLISKNTDWIESASELVGQTS